MKIVYYKAVCSESRIIIAISAEQTVNDYILLLANITKQCLYSIIHSYVHFGLHFGNIVNVQIHICGELLKLHIGNVVKKT